MDFSSVTLVKIRDSVRVSDVVSKMVKLQKKGKASFGLCPFHKEKSPSFSVNEDKNFYHCFGCGAHGDAIKFVQDTQNLKFVEAVKFLASEYNIKLDPSFENPVEKSNKTKTLEINKAVANWFHKNLSSSGSSHILEYLKARGLEIDSINKFNLGYAPANPKLLIRDLLSSGYSQKEIIESGIANEKYGEQICRFRDRIIFPINNINGATIAFGGRVVSANALPKYLNSPETLVFQKRNALYLEDIALKNIKTSDTIFVVEGYIDAIAMHSIGLTNTLATLGTAITDSHLQKLWTKVYTPTICMDGDRAGLAAINKAIKIALPLLKPGYSLKFIRLPKGYDPDSLIKTHGSMYFKDLAAKATNLSEIIWDTEINKLNLEIPENKALLKQTLLNIAETITDLAIRSFYKQYFLEKLSNLSSKYYRKGKSNEQRATVIDKLFIENLSVLQRYEFALAAILINAPELLQDHILFEKFTSITPQTKVLDGTYSAILSSFTELSSVIGTAFPIEEFQGKMKAYVTEAFFNYLCSNSSCFIDTIAIKTTDRAFELWFGTFERYHLELMKEEYRALLKGFDDKNLEMAAKLKKEIEGLENKIKTHAMNKDN
jgi:DNA primase catalytic core